MFNIFGSKPTANKKIVKKAAKITWKKSPHGGEYGNYKLGTIRRYKGDYSYSTAFDNAYNAKNLADAKKKIDLFTEKKLR